MEVKLETGEYSSDTNVVLQKREKDFGDLFSGSNHSSVDNNFLKTISHAKEMLEDEMNKFLS